MLNIPSAASGRLSNRLESLYRALKHVLKETSNGVFGKMWGASVVFQGRFVLILFVDKDGGWVGLDPVGHIANAARFLTGKAREFAKNLNDLGVIVRRKTETYCETHHSYPNASTNSGRWMVWTRSGPVEIIPIFAPLSRSTNCM